jgi:hypothetical protein
MVLEYETPISKGMIFDAVKVKMVKHVEEGSHPKIIIERVDKSTVNLVYNTIEQRDEWYERFKNQVYAQIYVSERVPDNRVNLETLKKYTGTL